MPPRVSGLTGATLQTAPSVCQDCVWWQSRSGRNADKERWREKTEEDWGAWGTLYFDDDDLLERHDYDVEISGGTSAAHYLSDYAEVSGIKLPTKHRIFPRTPDGQALKEPLVVSIDLSEIAFT